MKQRSLKSETKFSCKFKKTCSLNACQALHRFYIHIYVITSNFSKKKKALSMGQFNSLRVVAIIASRWYERFPTFWKGKKNKRKIRCHCSEMGGSPTSESHFPHYLQLIISSRCYRRAVFSLCSYVTNRCLDTGASFFIKNWEGGNERKRERR